MALCIALEVAKEVGVEINLIDLRDCGLNFCDGKEDESGYPLGVGEARRGGTGHRGHHRRQTGRSE